MEPEASAVFVRTRTVGFDSRVEGVDVPDERELASNERAWPVRDSFAAIDEGTPRHQE